MQFFRQLTAALGAVMMRGIVLCSALAPFLGGPAWAQKPEPWQMGMQHAFSPVQEKIASLHNGLLITITIITLFVGGLLVWVMLKYNSKANPVPSQTSHHTGLEIAWTLIPALILVAVAIPSFRLVYYQDRTHEADMTVKVIAHQWNWEYSYPDNDNLNFTSYIVPDEDVKKNGGLRLLEVDNQVVLPVGKNIRILTSSVDVIHSFFIPSLGVQRYAIPGRTLETWVKITAPGVYYGQCNQICGKDHSRMPIAIRAVPQAEFEAWLVDAKKKFAANMPDETRQMASTDPRR